MNQKSERFEMRFDPNLLSELDQWRADQIGLPSRAEAVRQLVAQGLARPSGDVTLSQAERLQVWMIAEVLKQMPSSEGKEMAEFAQDAICDGHLWAMRSEWPGVLHADDVDRTIVDEVTEILNAWTTIERCVEALSETDQAQLEKGIGSQGVGLKFMGFDGNEESRHMSVARFLIEKMDRYVWFSERDLNSHWPVLRDYRRVVQSLKATSEGLFGRDLSVDQLVEILKCR